MNTQSIGDCRRCQRENNHDREQFDGKIPALSQAKETRGNRSHYADHDRNKDCQAYKPDSQG